MENIEKAENKKNTNNIWQIIKENKLSTLLLLCLIILSIFSGIKIPLLKYQNEKQIKEITKKSCYQVTKAFSISVNSAIENNEKTKLEQLMVTLTQQEQNIKKIIIVNNKGIIIKATDKKFENQIFEMSDELKQEASVSEEDNCFRVVYPINSYFLIIDFNK